MNLWGSCKIDLMEGAFDVGDRNCTDDGEALFYLPDPDDGDGKLAYSVWVRVPRPGATRT